MNRKNLPVIIIGICICALVFSFVRFQPDNFAAISTDSDYFQSGPLPPPSDSQAIDPVPTPPSSPVSSENSSSSELVINYLGFGDIMFRITGIELTNLAPDWIPGENTSTDYLLISFELTNIGCAFDAQEEQKILVNCFDLYATDPPAPYGPQAPWIYGPDYFSDVIDPENINSYFQYNMPNVGESGNYTLAWSLDSLGLQMLHDNKLSLSCIFDGALMPIYYNQNIANTGGAP